MKQLQTTISENYVNDWGYKEGIREIMQNALDSNDLGFTGGIKYIKDRKKIVIFNHGAKLNLDSLLLGTTSKGNDIRQRGKYGEGFKVGSLALYRDKKPVTIYTGNETWYPEIDNHKAIKTPVLVFNIKKGNPYKQRLTFEIDDITQEEWTTLKDQFITLCNLESDMYHQTPESKVLLGKKFKGKVYCGGIFVSHDKNLEYGYDFKPPVLSLNRDRNMVDSFNLKWNTSKAWAYLSANMKGKLFDTEKMLKSNCPDVEFMDQFADYTVTGKLVEKFFEDNTKRSYPVTSTEEQEQVRDLGYTPVYSSQNYSTNIRKKLGSIEDLKRRVELDWKLFKNITLIDDANIQWVFEVIFKIDPKFTLNMKIAKFALDATISVNENDALIINCLLLKDKYEILHEAIRYYSRSMKKSESEIWKKLYKETVEGISDE